ncbi:MAG: glucose-6-phosphate isomerase [Planctomycetota bacterium]
MTETTGTSSRWSRYLASRSVLEDPFVELDWSDAGLGRTAIDRLRAPMQAAVAAMGRLEDGAIANPDEQRMVGHYWLRTPSLAPTEAIQSDIVSVVERVERFAADVHGGVVRAPEGDRFRKVVLCGIGGSALGPMVLGDLFATPSAPMQLCVLDNTDPDGIDLALQRLGSLRDALVLVVSKSGGTPETRNGMLEVARACREQGLAFAPRAVAVTMQGSKLDAQARAEGWVATFPMWDWVGGRTSLTSAVGLLPGALVGMDVRGFLGGAAAMDARTRSDVVEENPAALLAAVWHAQGNGRGDRAMVVLPYKDRLVQFSRYLQQLVMESLGKEHDRAGRVVEQGLAVFGNKGSTDQHAFVQQLRDGRRDFFATFVRVLRDRDCSSQEVEQGVTAGDYLDGFWQGTRAALAEKGRASVTLTVERVEERAVGALVALFERAVGLYAECIDVNAYHQPGVEAGKKAAERVLRLQRSLLGVLQEQPRSVHELAAQVGAEPVDCWHVLVHLAANGRVAAHHGRDPENARFARPR